MQPAFRQWKPCHEDPFLCLGPTPYGLAVSIAPLESPRVKLNESRKCPPPRGLSAAEEIGEVYWLVGMGRLGISACAWGTVGVVVSEVAVQTFQDKALRPVSLGLCEKSLAQESQV